jgi:hypothetical protein
MAKCKLCGREKELTFHHFIPKTLHKNKWFKKRFTRDQMDQGIYICEHDCHPEIHRFIDAKEMGRDYNTLELLRNHPQVRKYIKWIRKQV